MKLSQNKNTQNITSVKEFWDKRPCNINHSKKKFCTKEYFDEIEKKKYFVEHHIPDFAEFKKWHNKKVLEIGCGIGTDAINFARSGADYTGVELSKKSLKITKRRFQIFKLKGNFFSLNAENISKYIHSKYDLIYSFGVIHHTPNPRQVIKNLRNLIKKNGTLKIMLYAKNSYKAALISEGLEQPEAQYGCPIANTYDINDIKILFGNQFKIVNIKQEHIFPYKIQKYKKNIYEKHEWFKKMPLNIFRTLEKKFGWHLLITAKPK